MKKRGLLNPELNAAIARLGHLDTFVIADCGLPLPPTVPVIDLALVFGIPSFEEVTRAIKDEVVIDSVLLTDQAPKSVRRLFKCETTEVSHEELKERLGKAKFIVRTGSTTPFANAIVTCGVAF